MITDEMLQKAAAKSAAAYADSVCVGFDRDTPHAFSPAFEQKMEKLLRKTKHPQLRRVLQNIAAILLAVLVGAGVWLTVDTTARATFFHWVREVYETHIVYRFSGEAPAGVLPEYRPGWLPDGYREVSVSGDDHLRNVLYDNSGLETENTLIFTYHHTDKGTLHVIFDPDSEGIAVQVNGLPGHFYPAGNTSDSNSLVWIDQNTGIMFALTSHLSLDDILHIAESLELYKTTK